MDFLGIIRCSSRTTTAICWRYIKKMHEIIWKLYVSSEKFDTFRIFHEFKRSRYRVNAFDENDG